MPHNKQSGRAGGTSTKKLRSRRQLEVEEDVRARVFGDKELVESRNGFGDEEDTETKEPDAKRDEEEEEDGEKYEHSDFSEGEEYDSLEPHWQKLVWSVNMPYIGEDDAAVEEARRQFFPDITDARTYGIALETAAQHPPLANALKYSEDFDELILQLIRQDPESFDLEEQMFPIQWSGARGGVLTRLSCDRAIRKRGDGYNGQSSTNLYYEEQKSAEKADEIAGDAPSEDALPVDAPADGGQNVTMTTNAGSTLPILRRNSSSLAPRSLAI
ncbi:hypothetical protein BJ508DRAFT_15044 [Ascobolus immersus RN42]|uniref:Uncharacterized protein n=1 Tax=Ascobolus immersus RN42 TaxID=1160509 RepID=A0A3N4HTM2_ASCIM|nr:hypothetical protein BJ508DRAFT_15044 [Ascobolus immersus RN42]